jgi:RNA polymerase sigma-70 factor (ECF subfamily)
MFQGLARCSTMAEDLVQNTFLSLWKYRSTIRDHRCASAYLHRVALNQWRACQALLGRRRRTWRAYATEWSEGRAPEASFALEHGEAMLRLREAIDALPPEQRAVLVLHRVHGLTCPQIADASGAALKTVESRLRLALRRLVGHVDRRRRPMDGGAASSRGGAPRDACDALVAGEVRRDLHEGSRTANALRV